MNIITSDIVSLHGAAISMIGGRPENQDDMVYLDTPLGFLVVVCDGMGGGPGGKTASYIVKQEIAETLCKCSPQTPRDHALKMAAARAHQALEEKMKENPALSGMGSTFVAALLNSQSAVIAHSGDSRCYRLHGKKCLFRTQDHSLVAELVRKKVMTEEEARQSPQANVITRGLGSTNNHVPEIDEIPYKKGDRFVLCTDGIWGAMPHQKLIETFSQPSDLQRLLSDISTRVDKIGFLKGGGHDNHTIAMFEVETDSQLKDSFSWKKWALISSVAVFVIALICLFLWIIFGSKGQMGQFTSQATVLEGGEILPAKERQCASTEEVKGADAIQARNSSDKNEGIVDGKGDSVINDLSSLNEKSPLQEGLLKMSRMQNDSGSVTKQNPQSQEKEVTDTPIEITQKIINKYDTAKVMGKKSLPEAQKALGKKRAEIKQLFNILSERTKNSKKHQQVGILSNTVDANHSWDIDKYPDKKTKLYTPTPKAKENMSNQIERLKKLKISLEQESKN